MKGSALFRLLDELYQLNSGESAGTPEQLAAKKTIKEYCVADVLKTLSQEGLSESEVSFMCARLAG